MRGYPHEETEPRTGFGTGRTDTSEGSDGALCPWGDRLAGLTVRLEEMATSTEGEFLRIGERLHDFYRRAEEIARLSIEVTGLVSGEEIAGAVGGLNQVTSHLADYLSHMEHETDESARTLEQINAFLVKIVEPLAGFRKMNKALRMLGTATKIESARLGQQGAGFEALANDVSQLSVQVSDKSGSILEQKDGATAIIRQTLERVLTMDADQRGHVRLVLDKTSANLAEIAAINVKCSRAATLIASASAEVSRSIGEVVMSMQFHDIVRQQIEHVYEALDELVHRLRQGEPAGQRGLVYETADVCELQIAQLDNASAELLGAVARIVENLRGVASREEHMSQDARTMAGVVDQAGTTFFAEMESGLVEVTRALSESVTANRQLCEAMGKVAVTVTDISQFVGDIEDIGDEIELIALNAQIKAACTGADGAALGVLAEAIQHLSVDARQQTQVVSTALRGISEITGRLCSEVETEAGSLNGEVARMSEELTGCLSRVREMNEGLIADLGRLDAMVQDLSADIETVTTGITAHELIAAGVADVCAELRTQVDEARRLLPPDSEGSKAQRLTDLAKRYTMHSERQIHAAVANAPELAVVTGGASPGGDADLGDNIELF